VLSALPKGTNSPDPLWGSNPLPLAQKYIFNMLTTKMTATIYLETVGSITRAYWM
jgi:hypothetical protein